MTDLFLPTFAFDESLVRVRTDDDGAPWFVAKDVCAVLELANPSDALSTLDEDEKGIAITDTPGGPQEMLTISESGLYSLIFRSRKPEAKRFRKWVTAEVVPAIRKTGSYGAPLITAEMRAALERMPEITRRTVIRELSLVARENPEAMRAFENAVYGFYLAATPPAPSQAIKEEPPLAATFWQVFAQLEAAGHKLNHSASPALVAVNLPQFIHLAREGGYYSFDRNELRHLLPYSRNTLLAPNKTVRSRARGASVKCWVFQARQKENTEQGGGHV